MKKVVLITGASSGFGKEVAIKLLSKGYIVYAVARGIDKMNDIKALGANILSLDVTSDSQVEAVVSEIISAEGRIDVLFNNAGYGNFGAIEGVDIKDVEYQFNVNVFGLSRMIKAVLPYMRSQREGLIINTSSVVGKLSMPFSGYYAATKHAVEAISDALRIEVAPLGIKVSIIEPGPVKTGFEAVVYDNLSKVNTPDDYKKMMSGFMKTMKEIYKNAPDTQSTVRDVVRAIESKRPKIRYRTTKEATILIFLKRLLCDRLLDKIMFLSTK
ncbi:MAG: oxidoreductase [Rikenellaceae bacterium]